MAHSNESYIIKNAQHLYTGAEYGFVHSTGLWEDLRFPATGINPPGAESDPDRSTVTGLLMFDKASTESVVGVAQLPHSWKSGTDIEPHIHVLTDTVTTPVTSSADVSVWELQYAIVDVGDSWDVSTVTTDTKSFTHVVHAAANTPVHELFDFTAIDMTGYQDSCSMWWKLSRTGGAGADNYDNDVHLLEFDIHYRAGTLGSLAEHGENF